MKLFFFISKFKKYIRGKIYIQKVKFEIFYRYLIEGKKDDAKLRTSDDQIKVINIYINKKSSSNYFNFELNEKVINFLKNNSVISYPNSPFRGSLQGNILHFMPLVYEKYCLLYFTVDQIIYQYIELTNKILQIENVTRLNFSQKLKNSLICFLFAQRGQNQEIFHLVILYWD